jgi:hypothetical protein
MTDSRHLGLESENQSWPSGASPPKGRRSGLPSLLYWRRQPVLLWLVVFCLSVDVLALSVRMFADFRAYADLDDPDGATILRVAEYVRTGHLYPDINQPPYYPTLYSPLGYVILSIPYRLAVHYSYSPRSALRLAVFGFFLGTVGLVFLIARRLTRSIKMGLLASLFAASGSQLQSWPMRSRPDVLALTFALLGIWLCLDTERRWQLAIAAVCGGVAFLCKQTFIAMSAAVFLWFLLQHRFKAALGWAAGVASVVSIGYGFFILREPLAWQHFAALSRPIFEYREGLRIILSAMNEAKVLFFFFGAYFAWRLRLARAPLIVLYGLAALFIADVTIFQIGGNSNYFLEFWAISAILAAPGLVELNRRSHRVPPAITALVMVLLLYFFVPKLRADRGEVLRTYQDAKEYPQERAQWERVRAVLAGRRLFSFEPSITTWSSVPEVPDLFLSSALEQSGTWSSAPIVRNVEGGVYEAIIGDNDAGRFRVVKTLLPSVFAAVERHYVRACSFQGYMVWLPSHGAPELYDRLVQAGCVPASKAP